MYLQKNCRFAKKIKRPIMYKLITILLLLINSLNAQTYKITPENSGSLVGLSIISAYAAYELKFNAPKFFYQVESDRNENKSITFKPLYTYEKISVGLIGASSLASGLQILSHKKSSHSLVVGTMALEALMLNHTIFGFYKAGNLNLMKQEKIGDKKSPFISNPLSSQVSAVSFFTAKTLSDCDAIAPKYKKYVWGCAFSVSIATTYLQYQKTGNLKEAIIGSSIGALMGYLVPSIHKSQTRWEIYPNYNRYGLGLGFASRF